MEDYSMFVPNVHFEQIPIKNLVSNQEYHWTHIRTLHCVGNGIRSNQKTLLTLIGRECLFLFFAGIPVRSGAFQRTQDHLVLSQCSFFQLIEWSTAMIVPFNELLFVVNDLTLVEIDNLVERDFFQHLHFLTPERPRLRFLLT